ncbi:hypothetical protein QRD43_13800 [Pelomonas sp. APW6]|uniref:Rap1a immunity protein domain-containing protein n=1 Tax=Roseateles subflavus TaxID=3053353 RepID=A0ABT7LMS7_9BURK|nr:hypothetical protein [Pelomonas sp. APW6]MDL5032985.1 hypothetical protein [Pelomonas sp. APW6]
MRSLLLTLPLLLATGSAFAQGDADARAYTRQDLFVACLAGYVGAAVPRGDTPDYDESLRLATQILAEVYQFCPAPAPQVTARHFTDPDAPLHRWMLSVTRELVVLARQGASAQMLGKW